MDLVRIGQLQVSRFILGSNPFSGFSHWSPERDWEMRHFFSSGRIKATIREAEALGVNTVIGRTDYHMMRLLFEYRDEGGRAQWFAQTCPEVGDHAACIRRAAAYGAVACHLHGGVMDHALANNQLDDVPAAVRLGHELGLLVGIAGHKAEVFEWAESVRLDVDYYMCCYYNPSNRDQNAAHVAGCEEAYLESDRARMTALIARLSKPAIHYKILAAGRNDPAAAFDFAAQHMRENDAVCVGICQKDRPEMLREDVALLDASLRRHGKSAA